MSTTAQIWALAADITEALATYETNADDLFNYIKTVPVERTSESFPILPIAQMNTATAQGSQISGHDISGTRVTLQPINGNGGWIDLYDVDVRTFSPQEAAAVLHESVILKENYDVLTTAQGFSALAGAGAGTSGAYLAPLSLLQARTEIEGAGWRGPITAVMTSASYGQLLAQVGTSGVGSINAINAVWGPNGLDSLFGVNIVRVNNAWAGATTGTAYDMVVFAKSALIAGIDPVGITIEPFRQADYGRTRFVATFNYDIKEYLGNLGRRILVKS